jgi:hypothetical protein
MAIRPAQFRIFSKMYFDALEPCGIVRQAKKTKNVYKSRYYSYIVNAQVLMGQKG